MISRSKILSGKHNMCNKTNYDFYVVLNSSSSQYWSPDILISYSWSGFNFWYVHTIVTLLFLLLLKVHLMWRKGRNYETYGMVGCFHDPIVSRCFSSMLAICLQLIAWFSYILVSFFMIEISMTLNYFLLMKP